MGAGKRKEIAGVGDADAIHAKVVAENAGRHRPGGEGPDAIVALGHGGAGRVEIAGKGDPLGVGGVEPVGDGVVRIYLWRNHLQRPGGIRCRLCRNRATNGEKQHWPHQSCKWLGKVQGVILQRGLGLSLAIGANLGRGAILSRTANLRGASAVRRSLPNASDVPHELIRTAFAVFSCFRLRQPAASPKLAGIFRRRRPFPHAQAH